MPKGLNYYQAGLGFSPIRAMPFASLDYAGSQKTHIIEVPRSSHFALLSGNIPSEPSMGSPRDLKTSHGHNYINIEDEEVENGRTVAASTPALPTRYCASWSARSRTTFCINACAIIERVDEQLLPALYRFVGASFQARPSQLGTLTLARALAQAVASPCAGVLGHQFNRIRVICIGTALWGAMTLGFSATQAVTQGMVFWAVNGIGLSFIIPSSQSLTADYNPEEHRGAAFGMLHFVGAVGALLGALFATNIGPLRPLGMDGWRFAFVCVALVSWAIGALTAMLGVDPRVDSSINRNDNESKLLTDHLKGSWRESLVAIGSIIRVPTFGIIVLQGIVGTTPWSALVFLTLYFQLLGMSDLTASILVAVFLAANAVGGLLGGFVGDLAAARFLNHGRIAACQFSVGVGVPLSIILFKLLPMDNSMGATAGYAVVLAVMGLLITWAATACNNPIFSEIVAPHMRNLIYAFDRSFEGAIAAAGAPLVGILAEKAFGFSGTAEVSAEKSDNLKKARSLGDALLVFTALPWLLCAIFFSGLHWTYPRDKARAQEAAFDLVPAEEVEVALPPTIELQSLVH